jgi:hypothetical protein
MLKLITSILLLLSIIFMCDFIAQGYDNVVIHQFINENAAKQSSHFLRSLKDLGFSNELENVVNGKKIYKWFHEGASLEDETDCRSKFHFHDPTKSWDTAGLSNTIVDTYCFDYQHRSSLAWAQDSNYFWAWQKARQYYLEALTTSNRDLREQRFANTFRSLGQVIHLIADSSVPAHTRNDIHVFPFSIPGIGVTVGGPTFESWAQENYRNLSYSGTSIDKLIFQQLNSKSCVCSVGSG